MRSLSLFCVSSILVSLSLLNQLCFAFVSFPSPSATNSMASSTTKLNGIFDFLQPDPEKERQKEEMFQEQQRILEMRKNKNSREQYFKDVEDRRNQATAKAKAKMSPSTTKGNVDPMKAWLKIKEKGLVAPPTRYDDEPDDLSIPIPLNPIGMSEYDEGARFDLRLPYVDKGYVDEDATISGAFRKLFGGGKTTKKEEIQEETIEVEEEEIIEKEDKKKGWWGF